ncbi:MAG TPA: hypothetical protein VNV38_19140 [Stellaceae bacterium]|jgi:hypothetical protein|nr:hypothetical protein [Stellaceae bacterium]
MRGSSIPGPVRCLMLALLGGAGAALLAALPASADPAGLPSVGSPTPLVTPAPPPAPQPPAHATPAATTQPAHGTPAAQPAKRTAAAPQRIPLDTKPIIPPAPATAKLSPPPEPRPALPLETALQPVGGAEPRSQPPGASDAVPPPNPKPPSS